MRRLTLAAVSLAFLATACQPATTELTDDQKAEIEQAVTQAYEGWWNAWAALENIDDYMGYFDDWSVSPLSGWESSDALRSGSLEFFDEHRSWEIELGESRVLVLGPDVAALEGTAVSVVTDTSGTAAEWTQRLTTVWVLRDSQWKMLTCSFYTQRRPL
jgi:ketosteroid isomerase-like protein